MVNFGEAIKNGFKNYVNFTGRSTRAEFWFWFLFIFIVSIAVAALDAAIFGTQTTTDAYGVTSTQLRGPLSNIFYLGILLPNLAVNVRRLRDAGHHWAWIFIAFVPIVGFIVLLVFNCQQSAPNGWGKPTSDKNPYTGGAGTATYAPYPGQ